MGLLLPTFHSFIQNFSWMFAIGWTLGQQWKGRVSLLTEFIFSCTGQPVIVQSHNYSVQSGERNAEHTRFLTWPTLGGQKTNTPLGSEGHQEARRTGAPGRGRGAGELQGARTASRRERSEASPENRRCGRYCVQSGRSSGATGSLGMVYMDRLYPVRTLRSLWKVWIREEHNHIYSFKIQSRGAFHHHFPTPTSMNDFAAPTRALSP